MSSGVILYNYGTGCLVRMVVALHSLRKHYSGEVTILSDGEESNKICEKLQGDSRLAVNIIHPSFDVKKGKNYHFLAKCLLSTVTPYDLSLFIDTDVIVTGDLTPLFSVAEQHGFAVPQFSNWQSNGRSISRRILMWQDILPGDMSKALKFGPAINTGVMAFRKDNEFMSKWYDIAYQGRSLFIPDEVSCQVVLHRFQHKIVDSYYNASCRYDNCFDSRVKLIHYHGRKHCRHGLPYNGEYWIKNYKEVVDLNVGDIKNWTPAGDKHLSKYLKSNKMGRERR